MAHRIAVVAAALIFALTIGVLVGVVIHASQQQHANGGGQPTARPRSTSGFADQTGSSVTVDPPSGGPSAGDDSVSGSAQLGAPTATDLPASADPANEQIATTTTTTPAGPSTDPPGSSSSAASPTMPPTPTSRRPPAAVYTTINPPPVTTSRTPAAPVTSSAPAPSTTLGGASTGTTPTTAAPVGGSSAAGGDAPDGPCQVLGQKSATASGATLFCQRNQHGPGLTWRAVAEGGGCLNQSMSGIGLDGQHYVCRRGAGGLNHWVRG